jgi:hypothetical protein
MTEDDLTLRVAALKVVSEYTAQCYREARVQIGERMARGDRLMARSPLGKLGAVSRSDPKPTSRITDQSEFTAWVEKHYPERMVLDFEVIGSTQEIVSVLFEHAPYLLRKISKPDPELVKEIRQDSVKVGAPIGPGGEVVDGLEVSTPDAVVSCKPDDDALSVVAQLIRSNALTFDELVTPALPGGEG